MIERKRYLELCQRNSIYPNTVIVEYKGIRYYPEKLVIWFDKGDVKKYSKNEGGYRYKRN